MSDIAMLRQPHRDSIDACCLNGHPQYILRSMGMRVHISVLLLLAFPWIVRAQTNGQSPIVSEASAQDLASTSATYSDTIRMLKAWFSPAKHSVRDAQMASLFAIGDTRTSDLLAACRSADDEVARAALLALQLLGTSDDGRCADSVGHKHSGLAFSGAANLNVAEFERIEQWLAEKRTGTSYECGDDDPLIDDSLVYAFILDGSPRSESALTSMLEVDKACAGDNIAGEPLEKARSLILAAREIGHNLTIESDIDKSVRASAFFLPTKYRKDSKVEVLARTDDRVLLDVSYVCGLLCGRGYIVVLSREGAVWQYALITM